MNEPEDTIEKMYGWYRTFIGFIGACLILGMLYAMFQYPPNKPVPDCGSCRLYCKQTGKTK